MKSGKQFPALRDFLRGYFHEDCIEEYESLVGAARQFVKDADTKQRRIVAREWKEFLKSVDGVEKTNRALSEMGSACEFSNEGEIRKVTEALR